jgi:hypothetical protein
MRTSGKYGMMSNGEMPQITALAAKSNEVLIGVLPL